MDSSGLAAENHSAGMGFIDIITQPGIGPLRANTRFSFYDSAMDGSNPLIPKKGPAQSDSLSVGLGGTLIKEKSNFYVQVGGMKSYRTPNFYAAVPAGTIATNINLRQPTDTFSVSGNFDYALTRDQTLRISASHYDSSSKNQNVVSRMISGLNFIKTGWVAYTRQAAIAVGSLNWRRTQPNSGSTVRLEMSTPHAAPVTSQEKPNRPSIASTSG